MENWREIVRFEQWIDLFFVMRPVGSYEICLEGGTLLDVFMWLFQCEVLIAHGKTLGIAGREKTMQLVGSMMEVFKIVSAMLYNGCVVEILGFKTLKRMFHGRLNDPVYRFENVGYWLSRNIVIELLYVETLLQVFVERSALGRYDIKITQLLILIEKLENKDWFHRYTVPSIFNKVVWDNVYVNGDSVKGKYWKRLLHLVSQLNGTHGEATNEDDMGNREFKTHGEFETAMVVDVIANNKVIWDFTISFEARCVAMFKSVVLSYLYLKKSREMFGVIPNKLVLDSLKQSFVVQDAALNAANYAPYVEWKILNLAELMSDLNGTHGEATNEDDMELDSMIISFLDGYHGGIVTACDAKMLARKDVHMHMLENDYGVPLKFRKKIMSAVCRYRADFERVKELKRYQFGEHKAWKAYARLVEKNKVYMKQMKVSNVRRQDFKVQVNERFASLDVEGMLYEARECFNYARDPAEYGFTNAQYKRLINSLQYRESQTYEEAIAQGGDNVLINLLGLFDAKAAAAWESMKELWAELPTFHGLIGTISGIIRDIIGLIGVNGKLFYAYVTAMAVNWLTKFPVLAKIGGNVSTILSYLKELIQGKKQVEEAVAQSGRGPKKRDDREMLTEHFAVTVFKYLIGMIFGVYESDITEERSLRVSKSLAGVNSIGTFIRTFGAYLKEGIDMICIKLTGHSLFSSDPSEVKEAMSTTLNSMEYWINRTITDHREYSALQALYTRVKMLHQDWALDKESAKVAWNRCYKLFSDKYHLIEPVFSGSQVRPKPLGIIMTGKPGKGKTTYATIFATALQALYEKRKIEDYEIVLLKRMCSGDAQDVFWEGWMNNFATLIDEFLAEKDQPCLAEILGLASNAPHALRMAFEGKGKTYFTSRVLFLATNWENIQGAKDALGLFFPAAFARRFFRFDLQNENYDAKTMKFASQLSLDSIAKMKVKVYDHEEHNGAIVEKLIGDFTFTEALDWAKKQLEVIDDDYERVRNVQSLLSSPEAVEQLRVIEENHRVGDVLTIPVLEDDDVKSAREMVSDKGILYPSDSESTSSRSSVEEMIGKQESRIAKGKIKESIAKVLEEAEGQGIGDWVRDKMYKVSDKFLGPSLARDLEDQAHRVLYEVEELVILDECASWIDKIGAYRGFRTFDMEKLKTYVPDGYDWNPSDGSMVSKAVGFIHMVYRYVIAKDLLSGQHNQKTLFRRAREAIASIGEWIFKQWRVIAAACAFVVTAVSVVGYYFLGGESDEDDADAEVYTQQFERVMRRRVKGKDLKPKGKSVSESATGQVLDEQLKIHANVFRHAYARMEVVVVVDGTPRSSTGLVFQVSGDFWICTRHMWEFFFVVEHSEATVTLTRGTSSVNIPVREIEFREWVDEETGEEFDLMTMRIPVKYAARGRNLVHLFVEEKELDQRIFGNVKRLAPLLEKTDCFDVYDVLGGEAYGRFRKMPTAEIRSVLTSTKLTEMKFESTRYIKYPHSTEAGDCVSLYMINNSRSKHKAFAFHVGKVTDGMAVAIPVTQELLTQFVTSPEQEKADAQCFALGPLVNGYLEPIELDWAENHDAPLSSAVYGLIPEAHKECRSFPPQESKIIRTELFMGEDYERAPAKLKGKEVMQNVMAKANAINLSKKTRFREIVKRNYRKAYESIILTTLLPGKLSDEETAAQPVNSENLIAIRRDTSSGFGLKVGRHGKEGLIVATEDEVYTVAATAEFKMLLTKWKERTLAGEVPVLAFCAVLKDELRTLEKVNRPRLFAAGQLILNWFAKQYFGAAYDAFLKNPLVMKHAIGQDLNGPFGQHVYRMFKEKVIGYDIKNNDRTQWRERMYEFFELIIGVSDKIDQRDMANAEELFERRRMRWAIAELVMSPFVVYGDVVWRDWFFNPSGNWFTSWCNTTLDQNELYENLFVLMEERGMSDPAIKEDLENLLVDWRAMISVPMIGFGDDTLISYGDFTYDDYVRVGKEWHGRDYQPPDKGRGNEGTAFFLSRVPKNFFSRIAWLLPEDTIKMIPYWRFKSPESNSTMSQILCDSALAEWFYYGEEKFNVMKDLYDNELRRLQYPATVSEFAKLLRDWQSRF